MPLLAEVDWEKIILALGTFVAGALGAYAAFYAQIRKVKSETSIKENKQNLDSRTEAFREMQRLLILTRKDLENTRDEMRKQEEWFNSELDKVRQEVADCHSDKTTMSSQLASQQEQIRWLKRILKNHGWISDHDSEEDSPPRTKSDQFRKPPEGGL